MSASIANAAAVGGESSAGHGHNEHDAHDVASHRRIYWAVGTALLVGTVITVLARYLDFNSVALTVAVAMFIASIKAFLVAGYFMHLISEKKMVYLTLGVTAAFFVGMIALILFAEADPPRGTIAKTHYVP